MSPINNDAILSAVGFYNAFDEIHKKYYTGSKIQLDEILNFAAISIPYAVNGAFACEVAMKSAINEKNAKTLGHKLLDIYNSKYFSNKYKKAIKDSFISKGFSGIEFNCVLTESSDLFYSWRYIYESSKSTCSIPKYFYEFVTSCVETMLDFSDLKRKDNHEIQL